MIGFGIADGRFDGCISDRYLIITYEWLHLEMQFFVVGSWEGKQCNFFFHHKAYCLRKRKKNSPLFANLSKEVPFFAIKILRIPMSWQMSFGMVFDQINCV